MTFVKPLRITALLVGATLSALGGTAWADCDPPCGPDEVCRYEAAGGTFYCRARPTRNPGGGTGGAGGGRTPQNPDPTPGGGGPGTRAPRVAPR
jgi:hypothetical protein